MLTIEQAKANLLAHGEKAQGEIEGLIARTRVDVHETVASVKKALPWAAAAALGAGLFMGRRGRRGRRGAKGESAKGGIGGVVEGGGGASTLKWAVTTLGPIAMNLFLRSIKARATRPPEDAPRRMHD